jgi:hypothetical protein
MLEALLVKSQSDKQNINLVNNFAILETRQKNGKINGVQNRQV